MKPGEWFDVFDQVPIGFSTWLLRDKPCPGASTVTIKDTPQSTTISPNRTMHFRITVSSAKDCCPKCETKSLTVTAKQVLAHSSDSPPKILQQQFDSPDPDPNP